MDTVPGTSRGFLDQNSYFVVEIIILNLSQKANITCVLDTLDHNHVLVLALLDRLGHIAYTENINEPTRPHFCTRGESQTCNGKSG